MKGENAMDVKKYMEVEQTPFIEKAKATLDRIGYLVEMLDTARELINEIPEEDSAEGLKKAYKDLGKAFAICIDKEQNQLKGAIEK